MNNVFFLCICLFLGIHSAESQLRFQSNDFRINRILNAVEEHSLYDSLAVQKKVNRALKLAEQQKSEVDVAIIHYVHGNYFFNFSNYARAKQIFAHCILAARKTKFLKIENASKIRLAFILSEKDLFSAEKELNQLASQANIHRFVENEIEALNGLGQLYEKRQIKDKAMSFYLQALKIAEQNKLTYYRASLINNIGIIKLNNNQLNDAEADFQEALTLATKSNTFRMVFSLKNNLGSLNLNKRNFNQAVVYYNQALTDAKKAGFERGRAVAYGNLCNSYHFKGDFSKAIIYADSAIAIFQHESDWNYLSKSFLVKANLLIEQQKYTDAHDAIQRVFESDQHSPVIENYIEAQKILALIYEKQGKTALALTHFKRYEHTKDSIMSTTNWGKLAELQVLYGKEKLEFDLHREKSRNLILSTENDLKKANVRLVIIAAMFSILMLFALYFVQHFKTKKKNQALFSNQLIEKIDNERARISRDLHDDIGQNLSLVKSKIDMYEKRKLKDLSEVKAEITQVINQTRNISHNLHPVFITNIGLFRSLIALLKNTEKSTELICTLDAPESVDTIHIEKQIQLYRIIQECITNTLKHSNAKSLKIIISQSDREFELNYLDNGSTSKYNARKEGIGLMTIIERAKKINGKLSYEFTNVGFRLNLKFQ